MLQSLLLLLASGLATALPSHHHASTKLVYEYPKSQGWLENIAVRSNGELIMTSIGSPGSLNILNPLASDAIPTQITGFDFPSTLGIVEAEHDVFYVLSSNFSLQTVSISSGTNAVWKVDFNDADPRPEKMATVQNAVFLNGLTAFNDTILLAADSALGVVWAIDVLTAKSWIAANDPLMKPVQGQAYVEGINGLHFRPGKRHELCYTNSQQYIFACVNFDEDAKATGPAKLVARPKPEKGFTDINWDDFAFDAAGVAYAATEKGNSVQAVLPDGEAFVVAGDLNATTIATPTAVAFGRTLKDSHVLYAVTAGGLAFPVIINGTENSVGSQIVAVDTRRSWW